MQFGAF